MAHWFKITILFVFLGSLGSCEQPFPFPKKVVLPTSNYLNKGTLNVFVGAPPQTLVATVLPSTATDKTVFWSSSDEAVASVSKGVVSIGTVGTAYVTAKDVAGNTSVCQVNVSTPVPATGLTIDQVSPTLTVGAVISLSATVSPANATDPSVTWTTSNPGAIALSPSGNLAILNGKAQASSTLTARDSAGHTAQVTIAVGPAATITVTPAFTPSRNSGIAPLFVHFDAMATSSTLTTQPFNDILYTWDFGDPGAGTWAKGARPGLLSKNADHGALAGHVFDTPGTYTVTLTVFDGGSQQQATQTITVTDPETVYAGNKTICVSSSALPVAGVNGVPAGAQCFQLGTVEAAIAKITGPNQRLLFRRGDSFTSSNTTYLPGHDGLTIGAYGSGAKPLVNFIASIRNYGAFTITSDDVRLMDIDFQAAMTGNFSLRPTTFSDQTNILLYRLDGEGISTLEEASATNSAVVDCTLTGAAGGNGNVGIWFADSSGIAIMGNHIADCSRIEHNVRTQGADRSVYKFNTLSGKANTKHLLTIRGHQPKTGSSPIYQADAYAVIVSDNRFGDDTYGGGTLQVAPQNVTANEPIRDVIIERNLFTKDGSHILSSVVSNLVVRNNIAVFRGTESSGGSGFFSTADIDPANNGGMAVPRSVYVYNNSVFQEGTGYFTFAYSGSAFAASPGIIVRNNLVYAPAALKNGSTNGSQGSFFVSSISVTVTVDHNSTDAQLKSSSPDWTNSPPLDPIDFVPLATSYANGAATTIPLWDDFFGNVRLGTAITGAVVAGAP